MYTSTTKIRRKTGQTCDHSGVYAFDGYTDGTWSPTPHPEEREIPLAKYETFPPIRSSGKGAWWLLVRDA